MNSTVIIFFLLFFIQINPIYITLQQTFFTQNPILFHFLSNPIPFIIMNSNTSSSSSSVDSDEEFDHQVKLILELAQEAATLIQASTASLSKTRRTNIPRDRVEANERLMRDYFGENLTYGADAFRRQFRHGFPDISEFPTTRLFVILIYLMNYYFGKY